MLLTIFMSSCAVFAPVISAQNQPQTAPPQGQPTQPDQSAPEAAPPPAPGQLPPSPVEQQNQRIREVDPLEREEENKAREKAAREANKARGGQDENAPIPGSIAASQQSASRSSGPEVVGDNEQNAPVQEYTGPAVLSRSYSITQAVIPEQVKWNESFGISSTYNTGLARPENTDGGSGPSSSLLGTSISWTFGGNHFFKRDSLGVSYNGNYTLYSSGGGYSGLNHSLSAMYKHVLSKHLVVNFGGSGSQYSINSILQNQPVGPDTIANINIQTSPNIQIFSTGTKQMSLFGDLTWQLNARLSFDAGLSYFAVAQDNPLLIGMTGEQARGDVNYRLTRNTTVGAYYSHSHYLYPHGVGDSATDTVGLIYSYAFTRTIQLRSRGGVSETQSLGLVSVSLNPIIAALLGTREGLIDSYQTYRTTDISAQLVKDFQHGASGSISYAHGISPGNGVYQTSQQQSIAATLTAKVFRVYALTFAIGRDELSAVTQAVTENLGNYKSEYGRMALSRQYRRGIGLTFSAEYRHFQLDTAGFLRNQLNLSSGLSWVSGTGRLWPF